MLATSPKLQQDMVAQIRTIHAAAVPAERWPAAADGTAPVGGGAGDGGDEFGEWMVGAKSNAAPAIAATHIPAVQLVRVSSRGGAPASATVPQQHVLSHPDVQPNEPASVPNELQKLANTQIKLAAAAWSPAPPVLPAVAPVPVVAPGSAVAPAPLLAVAPAAAVMGGPVARILRQLRERLRPPLDARRVVVMGSRQMLHR